MVQQGEAVVPALELFRVQDVPIVRVDMWSHKLNAWVFLVQQKTGQNPPGTYEVTGAEIERMQQLIGQGFDADMAIYRTMGVKAVA